MFSSPLIQKLCSTAVYLTIAIQGASAETLIGAVTVNDALIKSDSKLTKMDPKSDITETNKRDCICFNNQKVEAKLVNGSWKIIDGDHWILDFAANNANAQTALDAIRNYKMNQICFVGRDAGTPMMFFLTDNKAPEGVAPKGEDGLPFDGSKVKAELKNGSWKLTCGDEWMQDFGRSEASAEDAATLLKTYGFTRQCFVGRPGATMTYYVK